MKILLLIIFSLQVFATSVTPLPFGHAALIYDAFPANGPFANPTTNPMTNHPGYWINNILSFNANAANQMSINRLYVYGTSLDTSGYTNTVNYNNSYAKASVASYRQSFPNVTILAIVDGTPGVLTNGDSTTLQLAKDLATSLAAQICADSNVDGVFFDLEPTKFGYQGLFTLYQTTSTLLSRKSCQDQNHPNGRYMGVYAYVNTADGNLVKPALGSNGFLAVPLYDVQDSQPPTPTDMNTYHSSVKSYISNSNNPNNEFITNNSTAI